MSYQLELTGPSAHDLHVFLQHVTHVDPAAVVRLSRDSGTRVRIWVQTPFTVLATRLISATMDTPDYVVLADVLLGELKGQLSADAPRVPLGYPADSAWKSTVPVPKNFVIIEVIPAQEVIELARRGQQVAKENLGPMGMAPSLLDQTILTITTNVNYDNDSEIQQSVRKLAIPMRAVFALTALGLVPQTPPGEEKIIVRSHARWVRLDARYGSLYFRNPETQFPVLTT